MRLTNLGIGKTIFEILEDYESAKLIDKTDNEIMNDGVPVIIEEPVIGVDGIRTVYLSQKYPIKDEFDAVVGMLGFSMDVTAIREQERLANEEKEKLQLEKLKLEQTSQLVEQQRRFIKFIEQAAHDIRSPLSSLQQAIKHSKDISENVRIVIRDATTRIYDIAHNLLQGYKPDDALDSSLDAAQPLLVSATLFEMLAEKKQHVRMLINFPT